MKKITALTSVIALAIFVFFANTSQAEFVAGKNYLVLDKPVETETGDQIEVRELFWYFCPHCFSVHPKLEEWSKTMDSSAQLVLQPAVFPGWEFGSTFYYVLEELGELERLHSSLYNAIHVQKLNLKTQQDFVTWLSLNGVDEDQANKVFKSFPVKVAVNKAKANTYKYRITGVPVFIVNGKYTVNATSAGSEEKIFEVIDYLIQKEKQ
ncbi:thiol:disulfide interchange protein DsbA/DsbL [Pseudothioglobus sp. nBUS_23]|uniref:thiol:disulfide interchange protein DsbA/DsbL n=1 Tax=Pseudothioglobus sp. nBUS_23 TaxID=3395318 RepID=UPI003EBE822C